MRPRLPVTTIGGYLGAGKTTLINHMLRHANGQRLAILVNEVGALSSDEDLIEAKGDNVISIAGGCICCSFGDNLIGTLTALAQVDPPPDHILIEASGVAIPQSIAASISLVLDFQLNGVVVLADADTVRQHAVDKYMGDTILRQIQGADLVVMTKTDLVPDQVARDVADWLQSIAGHSNIVKASHGKLPNEILLGPKENMNEPQKSDHSDADFESILLKPAPQMDVRSYAKSLAQGGFGLVRAKGFVQDRSGAMHLIQIVGTRFEVTRASDQKSTGLICIALAGQMDREGLGAT